ncbi:MAG: sel1 repeat family protein [Candidatus Adiutrix sp.]|jgi:TPR repeat protein|nr:sel1 repeat family protein [Candidatus Adiutrix sp.]
MPEMKKTLPLLAGLLVWSLPAAAQLPPAGRADYLAALALEYRADGSADHQAAAARYQAAAEAGSREAILALARLSEPGGPLWQGPELWRGRLLAASRAGWPEAAYDLARALEAQTLSGLDPQPFYLQAAAAGHAQAALRLGLLYLDGQAGLPKDEVQAALWLTVAAEKHEAQGALALGRMYYDEQPDLARRWLERAESAEGAYLLGELYLKDRRFIEALSAFTSAADRGYPPANLALGLLELDNDFGRHPNPRAALRHFKIAAQADLPEGSYQLARMYLLGRATPKDSITGAFWLNRAAARGHGPAREEFGKVTYNFSVGQKKRLERMIADGVAPTTQVPVKNQN